MQFNEHHLELSIMELFENQGYAHITGSEIHHEKTEVLLIDVLRNFLVFVMVLKISPKTKLLLP